MNTGLAILTLDIGPSWITAEEFQQIKLGEGEPDCSAGYRGEVLEILIENY